GNERLAELGVEKVIEMENLSTGPFSYGTDFYLGDIVTVDYPGIVTASLRVIESTIEITPKDLIQNRLTFGKSYPDLINISEYKTKNYLPEVRR
ncbi:MAG: siphovirus ReqiPepy6 Gp37-like family protein, partial [Actinobacteria bacterium]|nr:siphovirus ReqiPepy6 Gp37-like family protein [Actinomycetota bacterium]